MRIEVAGERLELLPSGAVYCHDHSTLFLADLHLGKETVFQRSGVPIPSGATERTIAAWSGLIDRYRPARMIVLGDLLHARIGLTESLERSLCAMIAAWSSVRWELIEGNHDRGSLGVLQGMGFEVHRGAMRWRRFALQHDPAPLIALSAVSAHEEPLQIMSGHLHPSISVALSGRDRVRLKCFWLRRDGLVLPAFGGWTGTHGIEPSGGDRVFACVESHILEINHRVHRPDRSSG